MRSFCQSKVEGKLYSPVPDSVGPCEGKKAMECRELKRDGHMDVPLLRLTRATCRDHPSNRSSRPRIQRQEKLMSQSSQLVV